MNSRRKFLLQGGMATTAILTAKPFKSLANTLAPVTGYSINDNKIILVHTGTHRFAGTPQTIQQISRLKKNTGNLLLVHAGQSIDDSATKLRYDAAMMVDECATFNASDYKIIYKGNIKIGIISTGTTQKDLVKKINTLSAYLKKERNCQVVVCLSQLGYKNKTSIDDRKLAKRSSNLDIIIGGHSDNYSLHPVVVHNSKKTEVIIHSDSGDGLAFRNIEIEFDEKGNKRSIDFNNLISRTESNS